MADDRTVARVFARSAVGRFGIAGTARLRTAAADSIAARMLRTRRGREVPMASRVRAWGVLLLVATAVQGAVVAVMPLVVRPVAPALLRFEALAAAAILIVAAGPLARAWPQSRARRLVSALASAPHPPAAAIARNNPS